MKMSLIERVTEAMADHRGGAHVDDIAAMVIERFPNNIRVDKEKLSSQIAAVLSNDTKKKVNSKFLRVPNGKKKGAYKRGYYRMKAKQVVTPHVTPAPQVSSQYTGTAGENAVISELLFYGYNASAMAVDDGIDVIASKRNQYFHIQVKTANPSGAGGFRYTIKKSSYDAKHSGQTFYIFVLREYDTARYYNDYLILPSSQVRQLVQAGVITDSQTLSLNVQKDKRGKYILNAKQDVTISVNQFSQLV
jgi:hypothetical protein